jgi:hypothetical protein
MKTRLIASLGLVVAATAGLSLVWANPPAVPSMDDVKKEAEKKAQEAGKKLGDLTKQVQKPAAPEAKPADPMDPNSPLMQAFMKLATPGEPHKMIQAFAGNWDAKVTTYDPMGGAEQTSKGTMRVTLIHGGRYAGGEYKGDMMGEAFEGTMLWGYNNGTGMYESIWIDSMTTGMLISTGKPGSAPNSVESTGKQTMPGFDGKMMQVNVKDIMTMVSADEFKMEMHNDWAGKMQKMMDIVYTRQKESAPGAVSPDKVKQDIKKAVETISLPDSPLSPTENTPKK